MMKDNVFSDCTLKVFAFPPSFISVKDVSCLCGGEMSIVTPVTAISHVSFKCPFE